MAYHRPWIVDFVAPLFGFSKTLTTAKKFIKPRHLEELAQMLSGYTEFDWKRMSPPAQAYYKKAATTLILGAPRFIELFERWSKEEAVDAQD